MHHSQLKWVKSVTKDLHSSKDTHAERTEQEELKEAKRLGDLVGRFIDASFLLRNEIEASSNAHILADENIRSWYQDWLTQSRYLQQEVDSMTGETKEEVYEEAEELEKLIEMSQTFLISVDFIYFFFAAMLGIALSRHISKPILALEAYAQRLSHSDYSEPVDVKSKDEIGLLAKTMNLMASEIAASQQSLRDELFFRKQSKQKIGELFHLNQKLLDTVVDGIFGIDKQGKLSFVNQAALLMLCNERADLVGASYSDYFNFIGLDNGPGESNTAIKQVMRQETELSLTLHGKLEKSDGSFLYVEYLCSAMEDEGRFNGAVVTFRDYSLKRELESRLKLTSSVFDTLSEAIIVTDSSYNVVEINQAFSKISGYCREQVIARIPDLLASKHQSESFYQAMWHRVYFDGQWQGELLAERASGEAFSVWVNVFVMKSEVGAVEYHVITFFDI